MSLSPEVQARLNEARDRQEQYQANEDERRHLGNISLVSTIGITQAGKTTVAANAEELAPEIIHPVKTTTSRPPKPGEPLDAMDFIEHQDGPVSEFLDDVDKGKLAQFVILRTGFIYATYPGDYEQGKYNLMPTVSSTVDYLSGVGFGVYRQIVVTPDINHWQRSFASADYSPQETIKRLEEAAQSLSWSLENKDRVQWLWNREGEQMKTAQHFLRMLENPSISDEEAIAIANRLLHGAVVPMLQRAKERM